MASPRSILSTHIAEDDDFEVVDPCESVTSEPIATWLPSAPVTAVETADAACNAAMPMQVDAQCQTDALEPPVMAKLPAIEPKAWCRQFTPTETNDVLNAMTDPSPGMRLLRL